MNYWNTKSSLEDEKLGLTDRWAYYDFHTDHWYGSLTDDIYNICKSADLLLNVSCVNPIRPWLEEIPVRVLIDTDPVFTQIDHLNNSDTLEVLSASSAI